MLKNVYMILFVCLIIYYPISFYKSYLNLKNSYTFLLFVLSVVITAIFHFALILMLNTFIKTKENNKDDENSEELIEEEIKKAMINE